MTLLMRDQEMIRRGRAEGRAVGFFEMVQDGICAPEIAAEKLGMTISEFEQRMLESGYQLPELLS